MDKNKGKSITTSVPSISIKFHANAEKIQELYGSDDDNDVSNEKTENVAEVSLGNPLNIGEPDNSPLKLLPKLVKRSTSLDVGQPQNLDASPSSDPWRFFSDIKGKITKSVEEKITEIKSRNNEEGSPQHRLKHDKPSELKIVSDSKENSSVSDSEDLSESSISRTCGIVSTTEGVEMSSDEDTPSLEKDKDKTKEKCLPHSSNVALRHRFRFLRNKGDLEEGFIRSKDLSKIYNINAEKADHVLSTEDADDVESAVDALEDVYFKDGDTKNAASVVSGDEVLQRVANKIANIEVDEENILRVNEVTGGELREEFFDCRTKSTKTVFAPKGFVDLRSTEVKTNPKINYKKLLVVFSSVVIYIIIQCYSPFLAGLSAGIIASMLLFQLYLKLHSPLSANSSRQKTLTQPSLPNKILEIQAVKEYQPLQKFESWANEYPVAYSPETYHISRTQSVYVRLQGNLLRLSNSKTKVPKRAMWSEPEIVADFTHHRIYNLIGAKISLLPEGLAKKRHWSKKYPICITLSKDQMCFDSEALAKLESEDEKNHDKDKSSDKDKDKPSTSIKNKKSFGRFRKKEYPVMSQRFSKLTEEDTFDMDSDSRASTPSAEFSDVPDSPGPGNEDMLISEQIDNLPLDNLLNSSPPKINNDEVNIYLFSRTDREKEDWYRRLTTATHKDTTLISIDSSDPDNKESLANPLLEAAQAELEYLKYMNVYKPSNKTQKHVKEKSEKSAGDNLQVDQEPEELLWLNALIGRVIFDCVRNPDFIVKVKDRIERKLSTIKLPYFIEELLIPELSLGKTASFIKRTGKPVMDDRGLWIDLDISYEGLIVLTLQTKLNLMRLKNPQAYEKPLTQARSAIYHSDVDDSAESSSDEDGPQNVPNALNESGSPASKSSESGGKKFIKMVDKLTESKFFQAATDNRYIKKAMEGVSNTDLRLTVEVKSIVGTLVLNIPPPPSDRIWLGFRPVPDILLSARPIVGERHLSYMIVTNWIEKKLVQEFQKVMVIPNMEDFVIPVMNPNLPE